MFSQAFCCLYNLILRILSPWKLHRQHKMCANRVCSRGVALISINFLTSFFNPPHIKKFNKLHQIRYKIFSLSTKKFKKKHQIQINCIHFSSPTFFMFAEFYSINLILRNCVTVFNSVMCSRIRNSKNSYIELFLFISKKLFRVPILIFHASLNDNQAMDESFLFNSVTH